MIVLQLLISLFRLLPVYTYWIEFKFDFIYLPRIQNTLQTLDTEQVIVSYYKLLHMVI